MSKTDILTHFEFLADSPNFNKLCRNRFISTRELVGRNDVDLGGRAVDSRENNTSLLFCPRCTQEKKEQEIQECSRECSLANFQY